MIYETFREMCIRDRFRLCAHLPPLLFHAVVWVGMALAVLDQISAMVVVSRYANRHPRLEQLNRELGLSLIHI